MWLVLLLDFIIINLLCLQIFVLFLISKCISCIVASFLVITVI